DAGSVDGQRAIGIREQADCRIGGHVPGNGVGREPVRLRLGEITLDAADDDAQHLGVGVPLELDVHAIGRHGEGNVGAVLRAAGAVIHVPAAVQRDLALVAARGNGVGTEAVDAAALHVLEPGAEAGRIPVAAAADFALEAARYGGNDGADVLGDTMRLVVVIEGDALRRRGSGQRDVWAVLLRVGAVVQVPGAVQRHLVFVGGGGGDAEGVLPDVAVGVIDQLRGRAGRVPVAAAAGFGLVAARDAHRGGGLGAGNRSAAQEYEQERQDGANAPLHRGHSVLPSVLVDLSTGTATLIEMQRGLLTNTYALMRRG